MQWSTSECIMHAFSAAQPLLPCCCLVFEALKARMPDNTCFQLLII